MKKLLAIFCIIFTTAASAVNMTSVTDQNMTGATAASAKQNANNAAVKAAAYEILGRYADRNLVAEALEEADEGRLLNMVSSTGISNERTSRTAYSAKFTVTFSKDAVEKWYADNNVAHFMDAADGSGNRSLVVIEVRNLTDWATLKHALRTDSANFNLRINSIFRNSATAYVNARERGRFQILARNNGWHASAADGILRISK